MSQPQFDPDRQPLWEVEKVSSQLGLTCPHCGGKVLVNKRTWIEGRIPRHYEYQEIFAVLRACPYCTQTAQIPRRYRQRK